MRGQASYNEFSYNILVYQTARLGVSPALYSATKEAQGDHRPYPLLFSCAPPFTPSLCVRLASPNLPPTLTIYPTEPRWKALFTDHSRESRTAGSAGRGLKGEGGAASWCLPRGEGQEKRVVILNDRGAKDEVNGERED